VIRLLLLAFVVGCSSERRARVTAEGSGLEWGEELFPLTEGDRRWYVTGESLGRLEVIGPAEVHGHSVVEVHRAYSGETLPTFVDRDGRGVWDYGSAWRIHPEPLPVLHFPVRVGKAWAMDSARWDLHLVAEVEAAEEVGCALGVFEAVRVRHVLTSEHHGRELADVTTWYTPGIGPIKVMGSESFALKETDGSYTWIVQSMDWLLRYDQVQGHDSEREASRVR